MKNKLLSLAMTGFLTFSACCAAFCCTQTGAEAAGLLNYTVSMEPSGSGELYWNYGKNMEFFVNGDEGYRQKCRIAKGTGYKFSTLADRGFVAEPNEGWYFDGVYDRSGKKLALDTVTIDIIRMKVKGVYYYDYIPSYDNPEYSRLSKDAYKELMKSSLKTLYGTRVYKILRRTTLYRLPKKDCTYYPKFKEKKAAPFPGKLSLNMTMSSDGFYAAGEKDFAAKYSSSNSNVIKIDKTSGFCQIKGPGSATLTVKVPAEDKTLAAVYKVKVIVMPESVTELSAARTSDKKHVSVKWKGDSRYSGYEIQISGSSNFSKITAKKIASSGKTSSTKVSVAKSAVCRYLRLRPYKTSGGSRLYGPYTTVSL